MAGPFKQLVELRAKLKERIPKFLRVNYARYDKIDDSWRKQRGRHNTIRRSIKGAGNKVSIGYGIPAKMKHLHPSGYKEVLVRNLRDVEKVDPKIEAIRIASNVGLKKRLEILRVAKERGIYVLNDRVISRVKKKGYESLKEMLSTGKGDSSQVEGRVGEVEKVEKPTEEIRDESKEVKEASKDVKEKKRGKSKQLKTSKNKGKESDSKKGTGKRVTKKSR